ncbi:ABC transporter substrate-binding protein [Sporolactobacillus vineae]|uniref:ABC transporter substrate-binding protein n=1 Tax=Sporolactobacillus vineae TaxID=444463 RepID=UPI000289E0B0|nr:ABC transporter substrate-binding protein [Sporolactobacillus vineae]
MKKRFAMLLMVALLVVVTALSGCSSSKGSSSSSGVSKNPVSGRSNELVVGVDGDPHSWDPIATFLLAWSNVANSVFEGLVNRDNNLKIHPALATSWKYINKNTLQFKLRKGVKFQDGEPFNAAAVKFTFDRLLGPEGKKGPQQANYTSIDHVQIIDNNTVNFILKQPDPVLITKLAGYGAVIVPPKYIKQHGAQYFANHPIGTGPYKMTSYKKDNQVVLEKNKYYWKSGEPKIGKVVFRIIPDPSTRLADFQTGAIDIMKTVQVSQAATVKKLKYATLMQASTPTVYSLRFNVKKSPVNHVKVRQAINYAIDKKAIIDKVLNGYGKEISTYQSTLSFGNNPNLKPYPYDPAKAKKLLASAGVKNGTSLDMFISGSDATFKEVAQTVSAYLQQVGLKVNIHTVDGSTLTSKLTPTGKAGQFYQMGWGGWTLDFDNTAYLLYSKGQFWNPDFYDPQVEKLLAAERSTVDQTKRQKIFMQLTQKLYNDVPEVNLFQTVALYAVNNRVVGFAPPHDDRINLAQSSLKK